MTLHNQALMNINENPSEGFQKLQFLLQQNPCPPGNVHVWYVGHRLIYLFLSYFRNFFESFIAVL